MFSFKEILGFIEVNFHVFDKVLPIQTAFCAPTLIDLSPSPENLEAGMLLVRGECFWKGHIPKRSLRGGRLSGLKIITNHVVNVPF